MSPPGHPTSTTLDRFLASELSAEEVKAVVRHLLLTDCCAACLGHLRRRLFAAGAPAARPRPAASAPGEPREPRDPGLSPAYDLAFASCSRNTALYAEDESMERLRATSLWAALEGRAHSQRLHMVAHERRFHERSLLERLLEIGNEGRFCDPRGGREIAELAVAVADRLDPEAHPEGFVADRRAAAQANLGNAQRLGEDLAAAERSFAQAWRSLARGSGDALERANVLRLEAGLRLALGDLEGGMRRLHSAAALYQRYEDHQQQGRVVVQMAQAWGYRDPWRGVSLARHSLQLIDGRQDPRLELSARHALIWFLNDSGASHQALELLESSRPLYRQIEGSQPRLYQKWLEGRICRSLGDLAAAETTLKTVWRDFRDAGFNQDLTLVSLDLAELFLAQGRTRHAVLLLRQFQPTLRLFKMHSHGMAAWLLVQEAMATEAARARPLVREAALYFRQAWRRPFPFRHRPHR
jgi:tetratricopeptide (TPR) repeat protein